MANRFVSRSHRHPLGRTARRVAASGAAAALLVAGLVATIPAQADTAPPAGTPATVSADALPTIQENGVVWQQITIGDIVYATGSFAYTWPSGQANNGTNRTPRENLLAYNITTGALTSFHHVLNGQGLAIAVTPDHTKLIVGGEFTTVDGQSRNRVAVFDVATGALNATIKPSMNATVRAITASNSTVWIGGSFSTASGVARTRLAAYSLSSGALLSWAPTAGDYLVSALLLTPDQTEVIVGGRFTTLNGVTANGLGAVGAVAGDTKPYPVNQVIKDFTNNAGIESLSTDGTSVFGGGFAYYAGNFEGSFAVVPDTGVIKWINDCHGDTYSVYPIGQVLYVAGHPHNCKWIGAYPDQTPRRVLAFTTYASSGYNIGPDDYHWNYSNYHDGTLLHWFPILNSGTVTGQGQAAWSVTGNSNYVSFAGEFPYVNGVAQAGLTRFAIRSLAPNKRAPIVSSGLTPTLTKLGGGSVRVQWQATWDMDNASLTYRVYRDGNMTTPVYTVTANSNFWTLPTLTWTNTGLSPGTHSWVIRAYDPLGNSATGGSASTTV
jgi:trimeric autotransporter adhesin